MFLGSEFFSFLSCLAIISVVMLAFHPVVSNAEEVNSEPVDKVITNDDNISEDVEIDIDPITQRLIEIDQKYDVGEPLSDEDANFIKENTEEVKQGKPNEMQIQGLFNATKSFNKSAHLNGLYVNLNGSMTVNHWNPLSNKFSGSFTGKVTKGTNTDVVVSLSHTAYGILGDKKVGKVFSKSYSKKSTSKTASLKNGTAYSAVVTNSVTIAKVTAHNKNTTTSTYFSM